MSDTQVTLFEPDPHSLAADLIALSNSKDSFGCCHRYRKCSLAKRCLIPDRNYSANCSYRHNLEQGQIFYNKTSIFFNPEQYSLFLDRIHALSPGAKKAFDDLMIIFCEYIPAISTYIVRNQYIDELSTVGLFEFHPLASRFSQLCAYRSLLPLVKEDPNFQSAQKSRTEEISALKLALNTARENEIQSEIDRLEKKLKSLPGKNSKEFLSDWLDHSGVSLRDQLSEPYRLAERKTELTTYFTEYYYDFLIFSQESRIYSLSPLAEDHLLPSAECITEEIRRIKLSPGYSPEEKARYLAQLQSSESNNAIE